jgi:hypothetical protein
VLRVTDGAPTHGDSVRAVCLTSGSRASMDGVVVFQPCLSGAEAAGKHRLPRVADWLRESARRASVVDTLDSTAPLERPAIRGRDPFAVGDRCVEGHSDSSHSAELLGVLLTDADGNVITDGLLTTDGARVTLLTATPVAPVPEPSIVVLLAVGA